jgi:hypothetical protein
MSTFIIARKVCGLVGPLRKFCTLRPPDESAWPSRNPSQKLSEGGLFLDELCCDNIPPEADRFRFRARVPLGGLSSSPTCRGPGAGKLAGFLCVPAVLSATRRQFTWTKRRRCHGPGHRVVWELGGLDSTGAIPETDRAQTQRPFVSNREGGAYIGLHRSQSRSLRRPMTLSSERWIVSTYALK